jgi:hypothetical protein
MSENDHFWKPLKIARGFSPSRTKTPLYRGARIFRKWPSFGSIFGVDRDGQFIHQTALESIIFEALEKMIIFENR